MHSTSAPAHATHGPGLATHAMRGPGVTVRAFIHAMHGLGLMLRLAPPGVPSTTFGPHAGPLVHHLIIVTCDPRNTHPMVTRLAVGVTKPMDHLHLSAVAAPPMLSPVLTSFHSVLKDPHWHRAMEEYEALLSNSM
jgi:hypothetical protein